MSDFQRPRVLVVMGGRSSEHEISCATAAGILRAIDRTMWDVIPIGITPDGQWVRVADDPQALEFHEGRGQSIQASESSVMLVPGTRCLIEVTRSKDGMQVSDLGNVDVVFPLLHGPYGEDGTIQGLFEMSGVPYVGCGVNSSAISMDKHLTKTVLAAAGIDVGRWELVTMRQWNEDPHECSKRIDALGYPVFVKPCRAGSSIGITRVDKPADLAAAIKEAGNNDPRIIVEARTPGREIECGVLARSWGSAPQASPLGEIVVPEGQFYDFALKYFDTEGVSLTCPADVEPQVAERIQEIAVRAFDTLECEGLARVDFFYDPQTGSIVVNEVNTMPGFTPFSMYPHMWAKAGIDYTQLLNEVLNEALSRPSGLR
ncbi:D-alanine--D-alanine ligase family protein [Schaalia sp. lx-260]|uniref:D-alanine--D-alanine ligase family protein n=1 Tax=Schaalia sp. lx-260 TaxID=2899082 RepID=UPI001E2CDE7D|nr:D-alanine--D-alanine ligase family protein [Schaalia sp. lx-260]MCD4549603.1 D-alanine--D-alanine ligase [Schaalia sp. lx-260]